MGTHNKAQSDALAAYLANNSVTKCAPEQSGKGDASASPFKGGSRPRKGISKFPPMAPVDTSVPGWQWEALNRPEVLDSIKSGVFTALIGSGWGTSPDSVEDRISHIKVILAEKYLEDWRTYDGPNKNTLPGYCRMVAFQKTIQYVQLKVHEYDGAVDAEPVNHTDYHRDDSDGQPIGARGILADDTSAVAFLRVEQKERLERALEALSADERSHFEALMSGDTSAEWAAREGFTPVQATRQKKAMLAKLAALVDAD